MSELLGAGGGAPLPVRRIGRYQVDQVVGTGAFATVYRAVDERLDDTVAVKVLADNHSLDPDIRERFLTEGRVLRRIDSPNVLTVHDLGETDDRRPFLVLEYADRGTLSERVADLRARGWRPSEADLWSVAEPLGRALEDVHRAEVVHRDLNPGNVLVTTRGTGGGGTPSALVWPGERLVLADLGLCKDLALNSGYTSAGGTEGFRPPELRHGPAIIDGRADLWSLAALMVWSITGHPPGDGSVEDDIAAAGLPEPLAGVLDRSLAADPEARHQDPAAWLEAVGEALGRRTELASRGTIQPEGTEPPESRPQPAQAHVRPATRPRPPWSARRWRLRHSIWLLSTLPFGFTTWCGFLYIGTRARRRAWRWSAAGYGLALLVVALLMFTAPVDPDGDIADSLQADIGVTLTIALWLAGMVHGLLVNGDWLRWRARSQDLLQTTTGLSYAAPAPAQLLPEPWRSFAGSAGLTQARVHDIVGRTEPGPLGERLSEIGKRVEGIVELGNALAAHGHALAQARGRIDVAALEGALDTVHQELATTPLSPGAAQRLDAIEAERSSALRLDKAMDGTLDQLRLLDARLKEAATLLEELAVGAGGSPGAAEVSRHVDDLLVDMETLQEAVEEMRSFTVPTVLDAGAL